jgi:hypothetical protein
MILDSKFIHIQSHSNSESLPIFAVLPDIFSITRLQKQINKIIGFQIIFNKRIMIIGASIKDAPIDFK